MDTELPVLFVAGGGGGAESLNRFIAENLPELLNHWQIVHQSGGGTDLTTSAETLRDRREELPELLRGRYFISEYLNAEQVNAALRRADLALSRSGAGFVNEVLALRTPAIFVPYPHARNDEQRAVALEAHKVGEGISVWRDDQLTANPGELVTELLRRSERRHSRETMANMFAESEDRIAEALRSALNLKRAK